MASEEAERAMACDGFGRLIGLFLGGKLDPWVLERFVDHAIRCPACDGRLLDAPEDRRADAAAE